MPNKEKLIQGFEESLLTLKKSIAYKDFCYDVYGYPIRLMNMLSFDDVAEITDIVNSSRPKRVIELGCGTGELLGHLAKNSECSFFGLENSKKLVEYLNDNNTIENLRFLCEDIDTYAEPNVKYDLVLIVDSLYFVEDIKKSVGNILLSMNPGGIAIVYFSEYQFQTENDNWRKAETNMLGSVIEEMGVKYQHTDITDRELKCWENVLRYGELHKSYFAEENNMALINEQIEEAKNISENIKTLGGKRFRYIIST